MAALQDALECLSPTTWEDIPKDPDALRAYMNDISNKARLIVDSIPEPPPPSDADDDPPRYAHTSPSSPWSRVRPSAARIGTNDPEVETLQKEWGKPIRINSARDNPLEIQVHKTAGRDGKGHWFGRRSVHEGLPFERWRAKLSSEMMDTLQANQERLRKGRTPDQSVRGIGAERLVEEIEVRDRDGQAVLGHVHVFHVSAQFPKPTTARDFVPVIVSWETRVEDSCGGRYWMMVSRPCTHPDVPPENGYIRGEYESVEFIREIPLRKRGADATRDAAGSEDVLGMRGSGEGEAGGKGGEKGEDSNPVEWIMVTRSDPGGNIPRWMVEKGTPKSICTDAVKFLDWACREQSSEQRSTKSRRRSSVRPGHTTGVDGTNVEDTSDSDLTDTEVEHHGLIASFSYLVNAGLERYAPQAVLDYLPGHSRQSSRSISDYHSAPREAETPRTSADSAPSTPRSPVDRVKKDEDDGGSTTTHDRAPASPSMSATDSGHHDVSPIEVMNMNKKGKLSSHEKQLAKLAQRKRDVESQLDKVRGEIQSLQLPSQDEESRRAKVSTAALAAADPSSDRVSSSTASSMHGQASDDRSPRRGPKREPSTRDAAKLHKVASGLFQDESKLLKQLEKIEKNQFKEASKIEARQQKHAEREEKSRSHTENEFLRREVEALKKEIGRLRSERQQWLNLVGSLQAENAKLAARNADAK